MATVVHLPKKRGLGESIGLGIGGAVERHTAKTLEEQEEERKRQEFQERTADIMGSATQKEAFDKAIGSASNAQELKLFSDAIDKTFDAGTPAKTTDKKILIEDDAGNARVETVQLTAAQYRDENYLTQTYGKANEKVRRARATETPTDYVDRSTGDFIATSVKRPKGNKNAIPLAAFNAKKGQGKVTKDGLIAKALTKQLDNERAIQAGQTPPHELTSTEAKMGTFIDPKFSAVFKVAMQSIPLEDALKMDADIMSNFMSTISDAMDAGAFGGPASETALPSGITEQQVQDTMKRYPDKSRQEIIDAIKKQAGK